MPNYNYDGRINPNSKNNIEFFVSTNKTPKKDHAHVYVIFQSRVKGNIGGNNYWARSRVNIDIPDNWSVKDTDKFIENEFMEVSTGMWQPRWEYDPFWIRWLKGELAWDFIVDDKLTEEQEWIINYILFTREVAKLQNAITEGKYNLGYEE